MKRSTIFLAASLILLLTAAACSQASPQVTPLPTSAPVSDPTDTPAQVEGSAPAPTPTVEPAVPEEPTAQSPVLAADPCTLLTQEDAGALFGVPAQAGEIAQRGPFAECAYKPADGPFAFLSFQMMSGVTPDAFAQQISTGAAMLEVEPTAVPNLGEGAYWVADILQVLHGEVFFQITTMMPSGKEVDRAAVEALAAEIITRLP